MSLASDAYEYKRPSGDTLIDILDGDSLLNIFYHCIPVVLEEDGSDIASTVSASSNDRVSIYEYRT